MLSYLGLHADMEMAMGTLEIIVLFIGAELIALALLLVATLLTQARKSGRKIRRRRRLWHILLPEALAGDPEAVVGIGASLHSKGDWKAFHSFIDEELQRERGRSTLGLRRLCRLVGLTERLRHELLNARDPLDRAAAGKTLARLRERIAEEMILDLLKSKDPAVVLAAAYATACFRDPKQFLPVFRAVYQRTPITLHGAAELLSGFDEGACPTIHRLLGGVVSQYRLLAKGGSTGPVDPEKAVEWSDTAAQVVMVDLLAFYAYQPAASTLLRLLTLSEDEEVLIHLVKAIAGVGDASATPRLVQLLGHPNWVIRSQSVHALGAVEAISSVQAMLGDHNLAVRASARETLQTLRTMEASREARVLEALV
jgi:HEAT repeat protein